MVARKATTRRKTTSARKTTTRRASPAKKTTARKTTTKKTAARKTTTTRKTTAKRTAKKTANRSAIRNAWTKTELMTQIADNAELTKKQVSTVFDELSEIIAAHIKKGGAGEFTLPGLAKIVTKRKPATKARKGINPFTGEEMMFKAKPAKTVVKVRPLKKLKDAVA